MAYNGDGPSSKRLKTEFEAAAHRNHGGQYGNYQESEPRRKRDDIGENLNHVLLFTIINPMYPITVDVLSTICSPIGKVFRIVIFKKNGVQAMVEFENVDAARRAKEDLNGADIYSGCCTLKIEYAKPTKLNVYKNDNDSWDFTNPNLGKPDPPSGRPGPLLKEPIYPNAPALYRPDSVRTTQYGSTEHRYADDGYNMTPHNGPNSYSDHYDRYGPDRPSEQRCLLPRYGGGGGGGVGSGGGAGILSGNSIKDDYRNGPLRNSPPRPSYGNMTGPAPGTGPMPQQGAVMMVYGLNADKINSDKLFNLFCLYGNVVRIKFLKTKEGCAMVQLGDGLAVERAVQNLNNTTFFGAKVQLGYSKQAFLSDVQQPFTLPDGTPSFKDYMGNKNNRFINPEMAVKNRIQPPSKVLHFFNTPPGLNEEMLAELFDEAGVKEPKEVKLFPSKTDRSSSGLLEFEDISEALEALIICNHTPIVNPTGKFPYIMKLCFSSFRHIPNKINNSQQ